MGGTADLHPSVVYAKTKQRVLDRLGRRTSLTRNPDVDFISGRLDEIRQERQRIAELVARYRAQLAALMATRREVEEELLGAWKRELGERVYVKDLDAYARLMSPPEQKFVREVSRAADTHRLNCSHAVQVFSYELDALAAPSPDREEKVLRDRITRCRDDYIGARTRYSDAMISARRQSRAAAPADRTPQQPALAAAKARYDAKAKGLLDAATEYEEMYRADLPRRVAAHFQAERAFARALVGSFEDLAPYTDSFSANVEEMAGWTATAAARAPRRSGAHRAAQAAAIKFVGRERCSDVSWASVLTEAKSEHLAKAFSFRSSMSGTVSPERTSVISPKCESPKMKRRRERDDKSKLTKKDEAPRDEGDSADPAGESYGSLAFHEGTTIELVRKDGWNQMAWGTSGRGGNGRMDQNEERRRYEDSDDEDIKSEESVELVTDIERIML